MFHLSLLNIFCIIYFVESEDSTKNCHLKVSENNQYFYVNNKTISKIPIGCHTISNNLNFENMTSLSMDQLKETFESVKVLNGSLTVMNSDLEDLSFFENLEQLGGDDNYCNTIQDNMKLTRLGFKNMKNTSSNCQNYIGNNPLLDLTEDCGWLEKFFGSKRDTIKNKVNCGCMVMLIDSESIHWIPDNCTDMYGYLNFEDVGITEDLLYRKFGSVKKFSGSIHIYQSNFVNLRFFENLEEIDGEGGEKIEIQYNEFLLEFDIPSLKVIKNMGNVEIHYGSIDGCVMPSTMDKWGISINSGISQYLCAGTFPGICNYNDSLLDLPDNCDRIIGNLVFMSCSLSPEELAKLHNVQTIYGQLIFINTNIENFDFLESLENIFLLAEATDESNLVENNPVYLEKNQNLTSIRFPKLKKIYSSYQTGIYFEKGDVLEDNFTIEDCKYIEEITGRLWNNYGKLTTCIEFAEMN